MPVQPADAEAFDAVIVGGGASGTLAATHLLRSAGPPLRIAMIEPGPAFARGVAYATTRPEHLLNVIASKMSAFDADPGHFVRYLADEAGGADGSTAEEPGARFAPRRAYARYLQATLDGSPGATGLVRITDVAIDIEPDGAGHVVVLASGGRVRARNVLLAIGNEARPLPLPAAALRGGPRVVEAWDYDAVGAIANGADVAIVGSGLSMVDVVVSLAANGHHGHIQVLSRHGLTPLAHADPGAQHADLEALKPLSTHGRMRTLRTLAAANLAQGLPWQWTLDSLRHHTQALWLETSERERRRFLRHAVRLWDIHRHRIAPEVAAVVARMRAAGQLQVHAGRVRSIDATPAGAAIAFVPRGADAVRMLEVGVVVNATGIETAFARSRRPLLQALAARGAVQAGPLGLGLATAADGAAMSGDGRAQPGLHALGALRMGELWETIAIPDIRGQAAQFARVVRARV